jgi:hypothetical protein
MPLTRGTRYTVVLGNAGAAVIPQPLEETQGAQMGTPQPAEGGGPQSEEKPAASVGGAPERQL